MLTTGLFAMLNTGVASVAGAVAAPGAIKNPLDFYSISAGEPDTLDPAVDYETAGGEVLQNVYETLIWYNGSSAVELMPMLATEVPSLTNGGISADGLTYTFHLRTGVKFHDGNTMTSEDVKFSIWRLLMINDPNGPAWILGEILIPNYYSLNVMNDTQAAIMNAAVNTAITTPDANTVVFHLALPAPYFLYCMAFTEASVVSKAYVMAPTHGGVVNGTANTWMVTHTCGTGPFMLNVWSAGTQVILDKNPNYWRTPAYFDHIFLQYQSAYSARKASFQTGDADWIYVPRASIYDFISTPTNQMPQYRVVMGYPTFSLDFIGLNQNITRAAGSSDTIPSNFFANKNARMAFSYAFDNAKYNAVTMLGTSITPNGAIPMGMYGYDASVPSYQYNLTKAANYLKQVPNPNSPGQSFADTGFVLTIAYNTGNVPRQTASFLLQNGFNEMKSQGLINGTVTLNILALDWPTLLAQQRARTLPAFFLGWAPDYADPQDYVAPFYTGTYGTTCGIRDPLLAAMIDAAATEINPEVRAQLYKDMSFYAIDQDYFVWTSQATNFHVEQRWVTGYQFNPMYSNLYYYPMGKVNYVTTAPDPVRNATATRLLNTGDIGLNWVAPVNNGGSDILGYEIYRGMTPGPTGKVHYGSVSNVTFSYTDIAVDPSQPYYYYVTARNSAGESIYSPEISSMFSVPGNPTYSALAKNQHIDVSWVAPIDNGGYSVTAYNVYRSLRADFAGSELVNTSGVVGTYSDANVSIGTTYYYRVSAVNAIGPSVPVVTVSAAFAAPDAPRTPSTSVAASVISVNWVAPAYDGGYPLQYYLVWRSTSSSFSSPTQVGNVTVLTYNDAAVSVNTLYYYKVQAFNAVGGSALSSIVNGTIVPSGVPTNLAAAKGDKNVTLTWGAPVNTGGATITKYTIYRTTSSTGLLVEIGNVTVAPGATLKFVNSGLSDGTTYYYSVSATNAAGESQKASINIAFSEATDNTMLIVIGVIAALIIVVAIVWFVMKGKKGPKVPEKKP